MINQHLLRILVVTDLLLVALSVVVGILSEASLPEPLRVYEEARSAAEMSPRDWVVMGIGIPLIITMPVANIGLLLFWKPARPLYLATAIVSFLLTPFAGPYVTSGWEQAMDHASCLVAGLVLGLIYCSPLREVYDRTENAA
jgi:hypothetical protein